MAGKNGKNVNPNKVPLAPGELDVQYSCLAWRPCGSHGQESGLAPQHGPLQTWTRTNATGP